MFNRLDLWTPDHPRYKISHAKFWRWKLETEANGTGHILDTQHINTTAGLFDVLNDRAWDTYRWSPYKAGEPYSVKYHHDLKATFGQAIGNIAESYDQIRKFNLLELDRVPWEALEHIWHELGRVKTIDGKPITEGEYYVLAVCKPLMFLWGQTPAFDSQNRIKMNEDEELITKPSSDNKWTFEEWKGFLIGLSKEIQEDQTIINLCKDQAGTLYGFNYVVPYGRFVDYIYYEKGKGRK